MAAKLARQCKQPQCGLEIDIGEPYGARQGNPLGLELAVAVAELHIVAIGALLKRDRQTGPWIRAERGFGGGVLRLVVHCQRPRIAAVRVIGAADEGAELAELEAEPAGAAAGAEARVLRG